MTVATSEIRQSIGKTLYDSDGSKIGKIGAVFLDDSTGEAEWLTVSTGFFGTNESFVPATQLSEHNDGLSVPFEKNKVKDAPNVDVDQGHLSTEEERTLYSYYGLDYSESDSDTVLPTGTTSDHTTTTGTPDATGTTGTVTGRIGYDDTDGYDDTADTSTGDRFDDEDRNRGGDDAITRSEERLDVGTEQVQTGRARLRKWVETEHQQVDVPVRTEKVRLESEPVTGNEGDAYSGSEISEAEHEVTLTQERPVVTTETVPVERVKLSKDVEEHTETVGGDVRKERIDLDADQDVNVEDRR